MTRLKDIENGLRAVRRNAEIEHRLPARVYVGSCSMVMMRTSSEYIRYLGGEERCCGVTVMGLSGVPVWYGVEVDVHGQPLGVIDFSVNREAPEIKESLRP